MIPERYQGLSVRRYTREEWPDTAKFKYGDFVMSPRDRKIRTVVGVGLIILTDEFVYATISGVHEGKARDDLVSTMTCQLVTRDEVFDVPRESIIWTMNQEKQIVHLDVDVNGADIDKLPRRRATDLSETEVIQLDQLIRELDDVMVSVTNLRARIITFKEQHG